MFSEKSPTYTFFRHFVERYAEDNFIANVVKIARNKFSEIVIFKSAPEESLDLYKFTLHTLFKESILALIKYNHEYECNFLSGFLRMHF